MLKFCLVMAILLPIFLPGLKLKIEARNNG